MAAQYLDPSDYDLDSLKTRKVAVLGYGNQGTAHAANLRDEGVRVVVGARANSPRFAIALEDGYDVRPTAEAAAWGDCILMALPDVAMGSIYRDEIAPGLRAGDAVIFIHGYALRFGLVPVEPGVDYLLVSHKGAGYAVREGYVRGPRLACLIGIEQDASQTAWNLAVSYAIRVGASPECLIKTTAKDECECDLFGEQVILCGGLTQLILRSFRVLTEKGYPPEVAYFECVQELRILADLIANRGLSGMHRAISSTAEWGDLTVGPNIVSDSSEEAMRVALADIQSGKFAADWQMENETGLEKLKQLRTESHPTLLEDTGRELRRRLGLEP